jgi:hypothetical protein
MHTTAGTPCPSARLFRAGEQTPVKVLEAGPGAALTLITRSR